MELAKIAYDAYGENRGWVTFNGDQMPRWIDQSPALQEAWKAAADAVVEATIKGIEG